VAGLASPRTTGAPARGRRGAPGPLAERDPVASVVVAVGLAHLDRPFDYAVPAEAAETAQPGVRVRVRFAGQLVDGFVLARQPQSTHTGALTRLAVVSAEPVLTADVARAARAVADHYAGTLPDVLRLAVPPRHARVEAETPPARVAAVSPAPTSVGAQPPGAFDALRSGAAFLRALRRGQGPAAVATLPAGTDWPALLAAAAAATSAARRGSLLIVPDGADAERVAAACAAAGVGALTLTADLGPAERYRRFLAVLRGQVAVVVGTRAAAFAPVAALGLVAVWDDGDDSHAEPRTPAPHSREVARLRAALAGAGLLVAGWARTAETEQWLRDGWAHPLQAPRSAVRAAAPLVRTVGDDADLAQDPAARAARLPALALRTARDALDAGPVLVQVPRAGYLPGLACAGCGAPARCPHCAGPLSVSSGHAVAGCRWCGRPSGAFRCPTCAGTRLRATRVGAGRTAEELGRAFPGVAVRTSTGAARLERVEPGAALVVATPGAEPLPGPDGYAAALLLDGWALLGRADLRAGEETLRRWLAAAALVRPGARGGRVVLVADPAAAPAQALVRWDPAGAASRELDERVALSLPPAVALAELLAPEPALASFLAELVVQPALAQGPAGPATVLGPVPAEAPHGGPGADTAWARVLVRVPREERDRLTRALAATLAVRSARKEAAARVRVDPAAIG